MCGYTILTHIRPVNHDIKYGAAIQRIESGRNKWSDVNNLSDVDNWNEVGDDARY